METPNGQAAIDEGDRWKAKAMCPFCEDRAGCDGSRWRGCYRIGVMARVIEKERVTDTKAFQDKLGQLNKGRRDAEAVAYQAGWNDMKAKAIKQVYGSYGTRGNLPLKAIAEAVEGWTPDGWTVPTGPDPDAPSPSESA